MATHDEERPGTAFSQFIAQKRSGSARPSLEVPDEARQHPQVRMQLQPAGPQLFPGKPPLAPAQLRQQPQSQTQPHRPAAGKRPSSSCSSHGRLPPATPLSLSLFPNPRALQAALTVSHTGPDYRQLAEAASSLAAVAKALASSPSSDGAFTQTYKQLAKVAVDLAVQSASHTPAAAAAAAAGASSQQQVQQAPQQQQQQQQQHSSVQRKVMPFGTAPAPSPVGTVQRPVSCGARSHLPSGPSPGPGPGPVPPSRAASFKLSTPRFPAYNPLIHLRTSELPLPGTPGPPGTPGTPAAGGFRLSTPGALQRPSSSNPITHEMFDASAAAARAGSSSMSRGLRSRLSSGAGAYSGPAAPLLRSGSAGDAGSAEAQVLVVEQGGLMAAAARDQVQIDPIEFALRHPDRVRIAPLPLSTPFGSYDILEDDMARRYNDAISRIRDKILMREPQQVLKSFKMIDADNSGDISVSEFHSVLKRLDFGVNDVEPKVLDMIAAAMDSNGDGKINFGEFVGAIRFNKIAYRPYNNKFIHKTTGNPDQPFGPTTLSFPWGTTSDGQLNAQQHAGQFDVNLEEVRKAFRAVDQDNDGVVTYNQFTAALKSLDEKFDLKFSEDYVHKMFREADKGFAQGVKYEELIGGPGQCTAEGHFTTEFLKPKKLRSSQMVAPWEWRLSPVQQQAELLATSAATLMRLGTSSGASGRPQRA